MGERVGRGVKESKERSEGGLLLFFPLGREGEKEEKEGRG